MRKWTSRRSWNRIASFALPIPRRWRSCGFICPRARPTDLPWQFIGDGNAILDAHRVNEEPGAQAGLHRTGETWEIELRTPQGTPFEIRGQRTTRTQTALTASLATLPAAVSHEGRLTIRSMDGTRLSVKASAAKPIPVRTSAAWQLSDISRLLPLRRVAQRAGRDRPCATAR